MEAEKPNTKKKNKKKKTKKPTRNPATGTRITTYLYEACRKQKAASKDTASKASYRAAKQRESGTETHAIEKKHRQEDRTRRLRTPSLTMSCSALWHSRQFDLRSDVARCLWNSAHTRTRDRGCKQHADGHLWNRQSVAKAFKTDNEGYLVQFNIKVLWLWVSGISGLKKHNHCTTHQSVFI